MTTNTPDELYPFQRDIMRIVTFTKWQIFKAKLFGKKYESFSRRSRDSLAWHLVGYHYKGKFYITKYGRLIDGK